MGYHMLVSIVAADALVLNQGIRINNTEFLPNFPCQFYKNAIFQGENTFI